MNLLRGPIERITIPTKSAMAWDEANMTSYFKKMKDVDTIEYNSCLLYTSDAADD
jgi:hypothetical protein